MPQLPTAMAGQDTAGFIYDDRHDEADGFDVGCQLTDLLLAKRASVAWIGLQPGNAVHLHFGREGLYKRLWPTNCLD